MKVGFIMWRVHYSHIHYDTREFPLLFSTGTPVYWSLAFLHFIAICETLFSFRSPFCLKHEFWSMCFIFIVIIHLRSLLSFFFFCVCSFHTPQSSSSQQTTTTTKKTCHFNPPLWIPTLKKPISNQIFDIKSTLKTTQTPNPPLPTRSKWQPFAGLHPSYQNPTNQSPQLRLRKWSASVRVPPTFW